MKAYRETNCGLGGGMKAYRETNCGLEGGE